MSTAIFTVRPTTLAISTTECLNLEEMGHEDDPIALNPGENHVSVGVGVFRILATTPVRVTAETNDAHILSLTKDGGSPDPPKFTDFDVSAVRAFLVDLKSQPAPV